MQCAHCFAPDGKPHATNCPARNGAPLPVQVQVDIITAACYPHSKNGAAFQQGMEYQDWIVEQCNRLGFYIQLHASKRYQFERGESVQRVEIKLDNRCTETGRLSIEVAERTALDRAWVPSGIYRGDNTLFYVQGNYQRAWLFVRRDLARWHRDKLDDTYMESPRSAPTVRKFYLPFAEADEISIARVV